MKNFYIKLTASWLIVMFFQLANGQSSNPKGFDLTGIDQETTQIKKDFTANTEIYPFATSSPIYGLAVKGKITFSDNNGLVRIILVDRVGDETLIYESYPLLEGATTVNMNNLAEETGVLDAVTPKSIRIEVKNATLSLQSVLYSLSDDPSVNKAAKKLERKGLQNASKIDRLNSNIKLQNKAWVAAETGVSKLSYAERKKLFGQSTFPSGIEYYAGGVISAGDGTTLKSATTTSMVENWDWRDRHGKNWVTGVKNQGSCGSCWTFASTGATEALVNLFYNQTFNLDLSEQNILSCSGGGSCNGGYPATALDYIKNTGIVDEAAFPYTATDQSCTNKSSNPTDQIKIGGRVDFGSTDYPVSEDALKKMIIKYGPISAGLLDWSHAMTLVGWKTVKDGDTFLVRDSSGRLYYYPTSLGNLLVGKIVWIFKNSWGATWGGDGYVYVETSITNFAWTHALVTPVVSLKQNYTVQCTDNDHDGYYWWGLGPKPANCPSCPDAEDGNDNDATLGPLDSYGNCTLLTVATVVAPVVKFSTDKTSVVTGGQVQFSDQSTNTPTAWSWTVSGPVQLTSTLQNPAITFSTAGTYSVTLTASNTSGSGSLTKSSYITVTVPPIPAPVAAFSANQTSVVTGGQVQFSDQSTNTPTAWLWTVLGPVQITSTLQNPAITFSTAGTYSVTLTASNTSGSGSLTKSNYITVTVPPISAPVAAFSANQNSVVTGGQVQFSDQSTNTPTTWSWTVSGPVQLTSTLQNPSFTFNTAGAYSITLAASNASGSGSLTKSSYITVTVPPIPAPVAAFSANQTSVLTGGQVQFSDQSTNTPTAWSWTVSGSVQLTSTLQNPSFTFNTAGAYSITLAASNASGSGSLTKSSYITVTVPPIPAPVAAFSANQTSVLTGGQVQFSDQSTNTPTAWSWTVSGPVQLTSTLQNPAINFNVAGSYSVTLKAANASGENSLIKTNFITVSDPLAANFVADNEIIDEGQTVTFSDLSTGTPVSWAWSLPGGNPSTSTQKNPSVSYSASGKYDVTLVVTNANGKSTKIKTGYITVNSVVPTYSSSHGNAAKEWISQVSLNGTTFNSASSGSVGYSDQTANTFNAVAGANYTMTLTPKSTGKSNYWYWSVWVDFNHDFDFNDAGEQILIYSKSKTAISKTITIPATALTGTARMRVSMKRDALPSADEIFAYGEVKDYTINISAAGMPQASATEFSVIDSQLEVLLYPNPAESIINLEVSNAQSQVSFSIFNIQGSKIKAGVINSDVTSIDLSDLNSGVYIISVKDRIQSKQIKFIKR